MGTASYAYNEAKMMDGIKAFREEQKVRPEMLEYEIFPSLMTVHVKAVLRATAAAHGIRIVDLVKKRGWGYARMRGIVFTLLREDPFFYSLPKIGSVMDCHHSTVTHGLVETEIRIKASVPLKLKIDAIRRAVHEELGLPL